MWFRTETQCYGQILPQLNRLAAEHGVEPVQVPRVLHLDEAEGVLAMEDLGAQGFAMGDKLEGRTGRDRGRRKSNPAPQ